MMKNVIRDYFSFSQRELNGIIGLIILIGVMYVSPITYRLFFPNDTLTAAEDAALIALKLVADSAKGEYLPHAYNAPDKVRNPVLFNFDPNTLSSDGWQQLGLSLKQAQSIVNYRQKGGKFYKPEDLQRMYTISAERYKQLKPFVQIADNSIRKKEIFNQAMVDKKTIKIVVDINRSDSIGLMDIRGIGPAFARRIVAYRERIGGFYSKEQLKEVYGIDSLKYADISDQISIDPSAIKKININLATFEDLKNNPYLRYKQMNAIIQYRKQHGNFIDVQSLKKVTLLTAETIDKLTPYLEF